MTSPKLSYHLALAAAVLLVAGCGRPASEEGTESVQPSTGETDISTGRKEPAAAPPKKLIVPSDAASQQTSLSLVESSRDVFPEIVTRNGDEHGYATILESLGSGCAALDIDRDGWDDVLVAGGGGFDEKVCISEPLYAVRSRRGRFEDVTAMAVAADQQAQFYNHGLSVTDVDSDGFMDVVLTGYQGVQLFRNRGDGTFASPETPGLQSSQWSASAAWGDFNGDACPDLLLVNYVNWSFDNDPPCYAADGKTRDNCSPKQFEALPDEFFLSTGDGGYADATEATGVRPDGMGLGLVVADIDMDGHVDAYIGNDIMVNFLYRNDGQGHLEDLSRTSGACVSRRGTPDASMGIDVADFDGDLLPDLWAANFEQENFALYRNQGHMLFRHSSDMTGISAIGSKYVGWGSAMVDLDLDGDHEIAVCNGHVVKHPRHAPVKQSMILLENGNGTYFEDVAHLVEATARPRNGRGLAVIDFDRDGRPDLMTSPVNEPAALLHNQTPVDGHWLHVDLIGRQSPRHPVGAILKLELSDGSVLLRLQKSGGSYASSSTSTLLFGFDTQRQARKLTVNWPSGAVSEIDTPEVDRRISLVEPRAGQSSGATPVPQ
ncbi:MAG: CRTAC1 family protein [Planctomycetaceae bacterium]|nr:CRTAC1 family protein [Planctomycetaceae bacterium]